MSGKTETDKATEDQKDKAKKAFLEHYGLVRFIAFESAPQNDLLGDIVNDTFVYFVEHADRWEYDRDLRPLLKEVTRNIAMRHWREHVKHLPETLGEIAEILQRSTATTDEQTGTSDVSEELDAMKLCLAKLTAEQKKLIDAYYFGKVKLVVLAKESGIKEGTLRKMMYRIRAALRACIERVLKGRNVHVE
ncbi:MAG: sigma-70 family RNA polymerase sigma factor [Planctomycetia bacterium]|nr:sigma-70 family RNA polymerase sigma factor [Planctomycetia bacterium]